ncbi:MAG: HlyD family efflux transporter periplasmic adaptor subunit [Firmicutes bacterium]|nr:HlyD family efflux transporter periplasmic adaptor subunit [Bacillota bacterium]
MDTKSKIICGVVALAVAGGGIFWYTNTNKSSSSVTPEEMAYSKTFTLTKGDLESVVDVDGVVVSAVETEVTTENTGKVVKLNVKVGDKVKKGDVICVLDSKDIDRQIKDLQEGNSSGGSAVSKSAQKRVARAKEALQKAQNRFKTRYSTDGKTYTDFGIENKYNKLQETLDKTSNAFTGYDAWVENTQAVEKAQREYDKAKKDLEINIVWKGTTTKVSFDGLKRKLKDAEEDWDKKADAYYDNPTTENKKEYDDATDYLEMLEDLLIDAESSIKDKETALDNALMALNETEKSEEYQRIKKAYDDASKAATEYETSVYEPYSKLKESVQTAQDAYDEAKESASSSASSSASEKESELEKLQEQKDACTLRAESEGEITQLNVKLGSIPKGSIALIQSTDKLIFEVSIPEESINKVSKGLMVSVTAASIDVPVTGKLTQISSTTGVTSTGSEGGGDPSGGAGYKAQITLDQPGGLHIGSKAHGSIILSSKKDVFVVPNEAVGNDEGLTYIRAVQPDGSYKKIPVTVGDSNETMVEISGDDLVEGIEILSDAYYEDLISTEKQKFEEEEQ